MKGFLKAKKGAGAMDVVIGIIMLVAVALPVAQDVIDNSTATGTTRTVIDLIPLFIGIGALIYVSRGSGLSS